MAVFFSVIVAVYNAEKYLAETLCALRAQTYPHFEVILVDDGSTDASAALARRFCEGDARFRVLHTTNRGISSARNLAVAHARGDWIAVCDADDTWHPGKLEQQADFIALWAGREALPLVALGTAGHHINAGGRVFGTVDLGMHTLAEFRLWRRAGFVRMINSSVVFPRALFDRVGGYRADYTPTEDTDLWARLCDHGAAINLPARLTFYRMHGGNISEKAYVRMMLNERRVAANTHRRVHGQPEWDHDEFLGVLRRDPRQFRRDLLRLRREMYRYIGRNSWHNGAWARGLAYKLLAGALDPARLGRRLLEGAATALRTRRTRPGRVRPPTQTM